MTVRFGGKNSVIDYAKVYYLFFFVNQKLLKKPFSLFFLQKFELIHFFYKTIYRDLYC
ncbi:hypothetical protein FLAT13_04059 [Flavobacterium salmonis]|uniref:Uncharacterized protein n=1 Tax=Flavobacterium salmonis TaxID=2654844 RepID=A0A6V6Z7R5_9FLAO|nr:hypothetical protein FLAT13_04059 [Flavobacterium salmonis]